MGNYAVTVEAFGNVDDFLAISITFKRLPHKGCGQRINLIMLFFIHIETDGYTAAVALAFEGVLHVSPKYLFREVGGVVFRHALQYRFQQNAFGSFGDVFVGGDDTNAVLTKFCLVGCAVVAITGKAVEFPNNDSFKPAFGTVFDHLLKGGAPIGLCRKGTVNVGVNDQNIMPLGIFLAVP